MPLFVTRCFEMYFVLPANLRGPSHAFLLGRLGTPYLSAVNALPP